MGGKRQAGWPSLLVTFLLATQEKGDSVAEGDRPLFASSALGWTGTTGGSVACEHSQIDGHRWRESAGRARPTRLVASILRRDEPPSRDRHKDGPNNPSSRRKPESSASAHGWRRWIPAFAGM